MRNICVKLFRTWASVQKGLFKTFFIYLVPIFFNGVERILCNFIKWYICVKLF